MLVSSEWLSGHSADPGVVILHVAANRTIYDAGHIPGARFVALGDIAVMKSGVPNELPPVESCIPESVAAVSGLYLQSHEIAARARHDHARGRNGESPRFCH